MSKKQSATAGGTDGAQQHFQERGLPRAVGPQETEGGSRLDVDRNRADGFDGAGGKKTRIGLAEGFGLDDWNQGLLLLVRSGCATCSSNKDAEITRSV